MPTQGKLGPALAISFLLHVLLLWPAVPLSRQSEIAQPLAVTLRAANGFVPAASPVAKAASSFHQTHSPPLPATPEPVLPAIPTPPQNSTPTSTAEMSLRSGSAASATEGGAAAVATGAGLRSGEGVDAEGVRQYRLALAVAARRFRRYPVRALEEELGGTVEVLVAVAAGGQPQEISLARSSGHDSLDNAALDMMRQAVPRTAVPERLRRRAFVVNLPVVFDLANE